MDTANLVEIFCIFDEFCKYFDIELEKHVIEDSNKRHRNRKGRMSDSEIMTILVLFHTSHFRDLKTFYLGYICNHMRKEFPNVISYNRFVERQTNVAMVAKVRKNMKNSLMSLYDKILLRKRAVIETVNDELKNICQIDHTRHRSVNNFAANLLAGMIAYNLMPKKPSLNIEIIDKSRLIA